MAVIQEVCRIGLLVLSHSSNLYYFKIIHTNKSSTFLSGYCTPQECYIEPFIPAASCGVFWKVLDKKEKVGTPEGITTLPTLPVYSIYGCFWFLGVWSF